MDWNDVLELVYQLGQGFGKLASAAWLAFIGAGLFGSTKRAERPTSTHACGACGLPYSPLDYRAEAEVWKCSACGGELLPEWDASGPLH